jgi:hypothetical protein
VIDIDISINIENLVENIARSPPVRARSKQCEWWGHPYGNFRRRQLAFESSQRTRCPPSCQSFFGQQAAHAKHPSCCHPGGGHPTVQRSSSRRNLPLICSLRAAFETNPKSFHFCGYAGLFLNTPGTHPYRYYYYCSAAS